MKKLILFLLFLSFIFGISQNLNLIKKEVEKINNSKNLKIKTVPNDYFVDVKNEVTDNGQELKGYYQDNQLKKITHSVGLSLWKIIREYFYYKNELIFVLETKFQTNDENGFINNPKLIYKNSYYFNKNKLIKKIVKETSDTIDFVKEANELKDDLKNYK